MTTLWCKRHSGEVIDHVIPQIVRCNSLAHDVLDTWGMRPLSILNSLMMALMLIGAGLLLSSCFASSTCGRPDYCRGGSEYYCHEEQSLIGGWAAVWTRIDCEHGCVEPPEEGLVYCKPAEERDARCGMSSERVYQCDGQTLRTCWNGWLIEERECYRTETCDVDAATCAPISPPDPLDFCPQAGDSGYEQRVYTCSDDDTQIVCFEGVIANEAPCRRCFDRELGGDWFGCRD